ncbi:purine-nucleoside phosphorylase [Corynebacterium mendelii]|uniref:Uridine phosphorylase n=1 Tax=Corynebacterium mendelii TaxID=2765362 RepID=A0A939E1B5_9CORY|nr:purine-nucleoside phosphorylase [Corynebacterium mendelii]
MPDKSTPHIVPNGAPIADTILLPGDPLRAKFVAETYLDDAVQFNSVRNALGFTGTYRGREVSVMGTGMGIPSISLYSWELIHVFGCTNLIRIGSCGSMRKDLDLYDIVVAQAASTDSNFLAQYNLPGTFAPTASFRLLDAFHSQAKQQGVTPRFGNVLSSDVFYGADRTAIDRWAGMGVLAVEMETAGLYAVAAHAGVDALGVFTVSDNLVTGEKTSPEKRRTSFTRMMELALPLAGA